MSVLEPTITISLRQYNVMNHYGSIGFRYMQARKNRLLLSQPQEDFVPTKDTLLEQPTTQQQFTITPPQNLSKPTTCVVASNPQSTVNYHPLGSCSSDLDVLSVVANEELEQNKIRASVVYAQANQIDFSDSDSDSESKNKDDDSSGYEIIDGSSGKFVEEKKCDNPTVFVIEDIVKDILKEDIAKEEEDYVKEINIVKEDAVKEDSVKDNILKEIDLVKEDAVKDNIVKENVAKDNIAKEDAVKDNIAKENVAKDNIVKEINLVKEKVSKENKKQLMNRKTHLEESQRAILRWTAEEDEALLGAYVFWKNCTTDWKKTLGFRSFGQFVTEKGCFGGRSEHSVKSRLFVLRKNGALDSDNMGPKKRKADHLTNYTEIGHCGSESEESKEQVEEKVKEKSDLLDLPEAKKTRFIGYSNRATVNSLFNLIEQQESRMYFD